MTTLTSPMGKINVDDLNTSKSSSRHADLAIITIFLVAAILGMVFVLLRDSILPERFAFDALHIQNLAGTEADPYDDESFWAVAMTYRLLGLADSALLASVLGYSAAAWVVWLVTTRLRALGPPATLVCVFLVPVLLLSAVFLGTYSKDVFVVLLVALVVIGAPGNFYELVLLVAFAAYAVFFRDYWFIVLVVYLGFRILTFRRQSRALLAVFAGVWVLVLGAAFWVILGISAGHYREAANMWRIGSDDAESMIVPFVALAEPLGGVVNVAITAVALLFPWPLALRGGTYYIAIFLFLVVLWVTFLRYSSVNVTGLPMRVRALYLRAACLVVAFVITQAFFEPDYGSYLRHLTPLLPLVIYVIVAGYCASRAARVHRESGGRRRS